MKPAITFLRPLLIFVGVAVVALAVSRRAVAQDLSDLELSGGYTHITGDNGLNGFTAGAAVWLSRRITANFDYDSAYNTSNLAVFSLTSIGATAVKNHLQNWLLGPRVFFPAQRLKKYKFDPFVELKLGGSHLNERLSQVNRPSVSASASSFTWVLGGGADYQFTSQWFGRLGLDLERTHFVNEGQSRLRLVLGVGYTFGARPSAK
jgi:opacity protein-like surface antigen